MATGSRRVIILALLANGGIAVAKAVAAAFTGSGSMLAESIHSFADCGNQGLLLLGRGRAARPATEEHPLGYGREAYFWALLVAVMLFTVGGLFSLYEGVHKLEHPEALTSIGWAVGVLVVGIFLEGGSLRAAWKECSRNRGGRGLMEWARTTGEVDLLVIVFEDIAATVGLVLALAAVVASWITGNPMYDALGSCAIGLLLLVVAVFVAAQVRRLIVGFAADGRTRNGIRRIWEERGFDVLNLIAVWAGPGRVIVACKVKTRETPESAAALVRALNEGEAAVRAAHPEVAYSFVEPDTEA